MQRLGDISQHVAEFVIIFVMIVGGISVLFAEPVTTGTPLALFLGSKTAGYVYSVLITGPGITLLVSKIFKKKKLHKHSLLFVYLLSIWLVLIEFLIIGFGPELLDQTVIGILAAVCWLRWKFKTEYIDLREFRDIDLKHYKDAKHRK